ncbi:MAG: siderophore-interacting protein [Pseudonocardiaceae bacterium]|nr:siderophore-interacting protein [Pseudonocardiaceae bacterium]
MDVQASTGRVRTRARRQPTKLWRVPVLRVNRLTPRMARVTVGGEQLADFASTGTDQHVMLYFYPPDVRLPEPLTLETARQQMSSIRPIMRSYTVRRHDPVSHEIDIDFVLHSHRGPAADWAARAKPGDELIFVGPSPAYQPEPAADWQLLIGDESALPAIGAILEELPAGARARAYVEIEDAGERQVLASQADTEITWVRRDRGESLERVVRADGLPTGSVHAWVAGERQAVRALRGYLLTECGLDRHRVRPTTYWKDGTSHAG